jgi:hypothetical protein
MVLKQYRMIPAVYARVPDDNGSTTRRKSTEALGG